MLKVYYTVLGLEPGATAMAVRRAYRRLARRYHPDKVMTSGCAGNVGKFNEVCQAYRGVIADAQQRSQLVITCNKTSNKTSNKTIEQEGLGSRELSLYDAEIASKTAHNCRRRSNRGSPSDRRFGWQLSEEYLGTQVAFKV